MQNMTDKILSRKLVYDKRIMPIKAKENILLML
jgi:hypothetical protein